MASAGLKSREEYLLRFEDQLLDVTKEQFASVNQALLFIYFAVAVDLLVWQGLAGLLPLIGAKISASEVAEIQPVVAAWSPVVVGFVLGYCAYGVFMIRKALSRFNHNAARLLKLNPDAKPITRSSIRLRRSGIVGVWLYAARKLAEFFSKRGAKPGWWRTPFAVLGLLLTTIYLLVVFLAPVAAAGWICAASGGRPLYPLAAMAAPAALLVAVVGQLVVRDVTAYLAHQENNSLAWVAALFRKLDRLTPSDDDEPAPAEFGHCGCCAGPAPPGFTRTDSASRS